MLIIIKFLLFMSIFFQSILFFFNPQEVRIMVVGDIMMHSPIIASGYDSKTKEYTYDKIFTELKPIFNQADMVIGNLETPLAGEKIGYSGYPRFNSPDSLAFALKNVGFDVLTTANNHSMDQWGDGVIETINTLDNYNIFHTGTFRSEEERAEPLILEVNGISIGIIAYTYGTNGLPVPSDKPYMVNLLDMDKINQDVAVLKENNVDYIFAMIHYGNEYQRQPSEEQKLWTDKILKSGVDFVLGSHPHVVQPLEVYDNGQGVIYSMGNFLSNQRDNWTEYGMILDLILEKNYRTGETILKDVSVIPTYVDRSRATGRSEYKIIPLIDNNEAVSKTVWLNGIELVKHIFSNGGMSSSD